MQSINKIARSTLTYVLMYKLIFQMFIFCVTDILRFKKKTVPSYIFTCIPSFKYGHHVLGISEVHQR